MTVRQLLELRPRLRPEILISRPLRRGPAVVHLLRDPVSGKRLEIGVKEHFLISRLDGTRSLAELGEGYAQRFRARLGEAQWQQLLGLLYGRGLLTDAPAPAPEPPTEPPRSTVLSGRVKLVADAPALLDRLHAATGFARHRRFLLPLFVLVAALLTEIARHLGELLRETGQLFHQPVALLAVGTLLWLGLALHELAHGLVGRAHGGRITEIGLRWRLPVSYLYCEVADVQFFARRRAQLATAGAGALANLVFLLPWYPAWALLPPHAQARPFLGGLLLLGTALALANLLPLPPLDGYQALGHAVDCLRLASESRRFAGVTARAALRRGAGPERAALGAYPTQLRLVYGGYALLCAALAAAALAALGPLGRRLLPAGWAPVAGWAPLLAAGLALGLWAAGLLLRGLRDRQVT
ncbi:peptidase M50 [Kitasatospora sp. NBC_01287]|uniref:peptidase M50 n=1 Tax=Kitasatospora sp. NBC_01287 TaxID=2903573 RepID=UPI00225B2362|nr:peptidase M50 [Kitasatospora sp. NBC_01287]MCX4745739.1 peptidase M50 [Kitasatospora sp. NBC_01287]